MKLAIVFGTRPEIIKLAPLAIEARRRNIDVHLIFTGQHRDLALPLLEAFGLRADLDLQAMVEGQSLPQLSARVLEALERHQERVTGDAVVVQGDTTSAFIAAYWAFCRHIPVAHVEAGLRTHDLNAPFPEEGNRQLISRLSAFHFAPTMHSANCLRNEGIVHGVHIVGNTAIDALRIHLHRMHNGEVPPGARLPERVAEFARAGRVILVTAHRRESHGSGIRSIAGALLDIVEARRDVRVVFPVHPNPAVSAPIRDALAGHPRILLCDPLPYPAFVEIMDRADLLLTDSGGIQEEGPSLRKPILVLRESTERPEAVEAGFARLVGTGRERIVAGALEGLDSPWTPDAPNPYGDGASAARIVDVLVA